MRELTVFTTNQTKLAHARYIAEGRQIRIKGFRQRTYHADYIEPRLASRQDILRASYESAKAQLTKAGFSEASHPFVLEDTSVRIDALSTAQWIVCPRDHLRRRKVQLFLDWLRQERDEWAARNLPKLGTAP
jgi:hypothetical protein